MKAITSRLKKISIKNKYCLNKRDDFFLESFSKLKASIILNFFYNILQLALFKKFSYWTLKKMYCDNLLIFWIIIGRRWLWKFCTMQCGEEWKIFNLWHWFNYILRSGVIDLRLLILRHFSQLSFHERVFQNIYTFFIRKCSIKY